MDEKKVFTNINDSGARQSFNTGSVRDTAEGKGMPHLIGGEAIAQYILNRGTYLEIPGLVPLEQVEYELNQFTALKEGRDVNIQFLYNAITIMTTKVFASYSEAMRRLAQHYANGAKKYAKNNWRKGQPVSRYYDSTMRHLWALKDGKEDEDHASAILWNIVGMLQTKIDVSKGLLPTELDDFPFTIGEVFEQKQGN